MNIGLPILATAILMTARDPAFFQHYTNNASPPAPASLCDYIGAHTNCVFAYTNYWSTEAANIDGTGPFGAKDYLIFVDSNSSFDSLDVWDTSVNPMTNVWIFPDPPGINRFSVNVLTAYDPYTDLVVDYVNTTTNCYYIFFHPTNGFQSKVLADCQGSATKAVLMRDRPGQMAIMTSPQSFGSSDRIDIIDFNTQTISNSFTLLNTGIVAPAIGSQGGAQFTYVCESNMFVYQLRWSTGTNNYYFMRQVDATTGNDIAVDNMGLIPRSAPAWIDSTKKLLVNWDNGANGAFGEFDLDTGTIVNTNTITSDNATAQEMLYNYELDKLMVCDGNYVDVFDVHTYALSQQLLVGDNNQIRWTVDPITGRFFTQSSSGDATYMYELDCDGDSPFALEYHWIYTNAPIGALSNWVDVVQSLPLTNSGSKLPLSTEHGINFYRGGAYSAPLKLLNTMQWGGDKNPPRTFIFVYSPGPDYNVGGENWQMLFTHPSNLQGFALNHTLNGDLVRNFTSTGTKLAEGLPTSCGLTMLAIQQTSISNNLLSSATIWTQGQFNTNQSSVDVHFDVSLGSGGGGTDPFFPFGGTMLEFMVYTNDVNTYSYSTNFIASVWEYVTNTYSLNCPTFNAYALNANENNIYASWGPADNEGNTTHTSTVLPNFFYTDEAPPYRGMWDTNLVTWTNNLNPAGANIAGHQYNPQLVGIRWVNPTNGWTWLTNNPNARVWTSVETSTNDLWYSAFVQFNPDDINTVTNTVYMQHVYDMRVIDAVFSVDSTTNTLYAQQGYDPQADETTPFDQGIGGVHMYHNSALWYNYDFEMRYDNQIYGLNGSSPIGVYDWVGIAVGGEPDLTGETATVTLGGTDGWQFGNW